MKYKELKLLVMCDFDNRDKNHPEAKDNQFGSGIYCGVCPECNHGFLGYNGHRLCHECTLNKLNKE